MSAGGGGGGGGVQDADRRPVVWNIAWEHR